MSLIYSHVSCGYLTEKCLPDSHLPIVYLTILSVSPLWVTRETHPSIKTSKILLWIVMPNISGKVTEECHCSSSKHKTKWNPQAKFSRWRPPDLHADTAGNPLAKFSVSRVQTCSIFLHQIYSNFNVENMVIKGAFTTTRETCRAPRPTAGAYSDLSRSDSFAGPTGIGSADW